MEGPKTEAIKTDESSKSSGIKPISIKPVPGIKPAVVI